MDSHIVSIYWAEMKEGQKMKSPNSQRWWKPFLMTGFDYSAVKENGPSEVRKFILWVLVAGWDFDSCSILHRCWIKCWVLHLIHLWLLRVSINDSSDSNRLEAVVPWAPVRMEILAWTSVVYQQHLTSYFTDISCSLALPFQDMVQLCRLHIQQYPCWMDSFFSWMWR